MIVLGIMPLKIYIFKILNCINFAVVQKALL